MTIFCIKEEPFNIINDIIISLISFPEEIIEKSNKCLLIDIINLFEKYLFSQNYPNIILTETPIWLKLLDNHEYIPINQNEITNNKNKVPTNNKLEIQTKLYAFLIKIFNEK